MGATVEIASYKKEIDSMRKEMQIVSVTVTYCSLHFVIPYSTLVYLFVVQSCDNGSLSTRFLGKPQGISSHPVANYIITPISFIKLTFILIG
ncbi:unnamed protein product [Trichobilharzia regenti]|nr:unnamed protein product [Trichobilharzia regenti]